MEIRSFPFDDGGLSVIAGGLFSIVIALLLLEDLFHRFMDRS